MVRAFHPQGFPGSLTTNTNYPPQNFNEASGGAPPDIGFELINEPLPPNTGTLQWDDIGIGDSGNVEFDSTG
jgi:hypothetical protein